MKIKVVSNTSPITNLLSVGQISLLKLVYGEIVIPQAVKIELESYHGSVVFESLSWLKCMHVRDRSGVVSALGKGEAEAIVLAQEVRANLLLIDDYKARKEAEKRNLIVKGLLGVVQSAHQLGYLNLVKPLLDSLITNGFRVSEELYLRVLEESGEA